ncbi:MAG: MlaE family ABC transporter permease [Solirubrobacteraceae bacterium]
MKSFFKNVRDYLYLMVKTLKKPQNKDIFFKQVIHEMEDLGVSSLGIVVFISVFMGLIITIQMYDNLSTASIPIPSYFASSASKTVLILEFCPTIISIILAGKAGSFIASSIGTMRVTEQIDALEVMGINTASFLILPKIVANIIFNPILIFISFNISILGIMLSSFLIPQLTWFDILTGLQNPFKDLYYVYAFIKSVFFGFVIATIPAYYGYNVIGGSLEVGRASTSAVVSTSISIIILNLILTKLILG